MFLCSIVHSIQWKYTIKSAVAWDARRVEESCSLFDLFDWRIDKEVNWIQVVIVAVGYDSKVNEKIII